MESSHERNDVATICLAAVDIGYIANELINAARDTLGVVDLQDAWNSLVGAVPMVGDTISLFMDPAGFLELAEVGLGDDEPILLQDIPSAVASLTELIGLQPHVQISVDEASSELSIVNFAHTVIDVERQFGLSFGTWFDPYASVSQVRPPRSAPRICAHPGRPSGPVCR